MARPMTKELAFAGKQPIIGPTIQGNTDFKRPDAAQGIKLGGE